MLWENLTSPLSMKIRNSSIIIRSRKTKINKYISRNRYKFWTRCSHVINQNQSRNTNRRNAISVGQVRSQVRLSSQEWFRWVPQTRVLLGSVLPAPRTVLTFLSSRFADPDRMKVKFQSRSQPKSSNRDPFSRKFFSPQEKKKKEYRRWAPLKGPFSFFRGNPRSQRRFCFV